MVFAAMSTVLGVCENILAMIRDLTGWSRIKGSLICGIVVFVLALTTALGFSVLHFQPFAEGTTWLDFGTSLFQQMFFLSVLLCLLCSVATSSAGVGITSLKKPTWASV